MNARMYAVTAGVEAAWRQLLEHIAADADLALTYMSYPAPQPLEQLWSRPDLSCALMCGFPIALKLASVIPIAAPIPRAPWAHGEALYRSDLIVRQDAPYSSLADTFGARAGWTVEHSHSGFNAFRHHLLAYRTPSRPKLYSQMLGRLITARNILDSVREGRIDIGPLDSYWHLLIAHHAPELTAGVRVLAVTETAPAPAFVASAATPAGEVARLRQAFRSAASQPWFKPLSDILLLDGFAGADAARYATLLEWDRSARVAGYAVPA